MTTPLLMKTPVVLLCLLAVVNATVACTKKTAEKIHRYKTSAEGFVFSIDDSAKFTFSLQGKTWLNSAHAFLYTDGRRLSVEDGSLRLDHREQKKGTDKMGAWQSQCFVYIANESFWELCAKVWLNYAEPRVVFQQHFINVTHHSARDPDRVISAFPSFQLPADDTGLAFLSYQGSMFGGTDIAVHKWKAGDASMSGGIVGGPLAVFDQNNGVCIVAPFSEFMSSSRELDERWRVNWGVMGGVQSVPAGFVHQTLVYCDIKGINQVFSDWGKFMRMYYNKEDVYRKTDFTVKYLGYWTDAGAYYYYNTEPNSNYQKTLLDIKNYIDSQHIPVRYIQYDSWFYPKGPKGGVMTWNVTSDIAPNGFQYLFNKNHWPVAAHNRYCLGELDRGQAQLSSKTPYAKFNGGRYYFVVEKDKALPLDTGWLDRQFGEMNVTQSTVDTARTWLLQMVQAARAAGLTIQYCMANPRHAMQSLEIPVVTQARVSSDYRAGNDQWRMEEISIFADAMGIAPSKDTFWTTRIQPANTYKLQEPNPELQAAVATLSTGPVGPSDMIRHTNVSMLMQCCRADGLILKPAKPATAIDKQFWQKAFGNGAGPQGELWTTYTKVGGWYFGIILAAAMETEFSLTPSDAGFQFFDPRTVMTRSAHSVTPVQYLFNDASPLVLTNLCSSEDFCMYYTSPIFNIGGQLIALYGEEYKFVPMSSDRVTNIDITADDIIVTMRGTAGESTVFTNFINGEIIRHSCNFGQGGEVILSVRGLHTDCTHVSG